MLDEKDMTVTRPAVECAKKMERCARISCSVCAKPSKPPMACRPALVGDLHEADLGAVIEALDAELRPRWSS